MSDSLCVMRGKLLHVGSGDRVREHRTPAYKLVIGVDAELTLQCAGARGQLRAVLVPPCVAQALHAPGLALGIFMEAGGPLTPYAAPTTCLAIHGQRAAALLTLARAFVRDGCRDEAAFSEDAYRVLALEPAARRLDARSERCLRSLRHAPNRSLGELAAAVRLSPERLRHLVAEQTGIPLREHRLLQRTTLAMEQVLGGAAIAAAARFAGFADHAHLTRTFGRLFGRTPSSLPAHVRLHASWGERG